MARRARRPFLVVVLASFVLYSTCSLFLTPRLSTPTGATPRLRASRAIYGDEGIGPSKPDEPSLGSRLARGGALASMLAVGSVLGYGLRRVLPGFIQKASHTIQLLLRDTPPEMPPVVVYPPNTVFWYKSPDLGAKLEIPATIPLTDTLTDAAVRERIRRQISQSSWWEDKLPSMTTVMEIGSTLLSLWSRSGSNG
ncbi:hypothetical protein Pmar_PMAR021118 [Perkinsus marinus ATCC 50983]|uniref:Transmembrane protein n=1 Tax=Perkinsus marinus (strain ATCC 50983 / TXsc) TaxID=423536 RepID=C5KGG2_PERM5|nr:hypothetical protein Pmar_PMAR021118 [Perkinsus marinus ATCC 50983]EER16518.1 hypothetical protein Pmar_PMAR021118 [Perkinsus marinus ATCC 50983]|eukprot:XP_002784722.1 hypothetical protein Pmar_PMAR021118 [Perkinsus marinus ATCC 50983]